MLFRVLFLFTLVANLFFSCKKKENFIVITGSVTDKKSGLGADGITLKLYIEENNVNAYNNSLTLLETTTTRSNGSYTFKKPYKNAIKYQIVTEGNDYYNQTFDLNPDNLSTATDNVYDISLFSRSYYEIALKNATPFDNNDEIVFSISNTDLSSPDGCGAVSLDLTGNLVDTLIQCPIYGGQTIYYSYVVTKNNITTQYDGSQYCPVGDTAKITIQY